MRMRLTLLAHGAMENRHVEVVNRWGNSLKVMVDSLHDVMSLLTAQKTEAFSIKYFLNKAFLLDTSDALGLIVPQR